MLHLQIPCRGRGQPPTPEEVNECIWELQKATEHFKAEGGFVAIHCTHGFNRTGAQDRRGAGSVLLSLAAKHGVTPGTSKHVSNPVVLHQA
jgi:hypothetical protein